MHFRYPVRNTSLRCRKVTRAGYIDAAATRTGRRVRILLAMPTTFGLSNTSWSVPHFRRSGSAADPSSGVLRVRTYPRAPIEGRARNTRSRIEVVGAELRDSDLSLLLRRLLRFGKFRLRGLNFLFDQLYEVYSR